MLALEPCSGSIVITDVNNGDVLAMVTYPSYDNNMLANKIDWDYYSKLLANSATPLLNRPTQQQTATGSTFKPLMALAGMAEGVITTQTKIKDEGLFELVDPSPKCWKYPGNHGWINLTQAIQHSCNYFFYQVGYNMSLDAKGEYSDSLGISKIQKYASWFGLADKSGVEVPESTPAISSTDAVRTSIGYYHNFAPIQISRYVTSVANKGTVFNLTIVDKTVNKETGEETDNSATVFNRIDSYTDNQWNAVQKGMYDVVNTSANSLNTLYGDLGFKVAGKTGTAQVSLTHPSHGLFISFAPYSKPEVSVTVVIPNGYASANAAKLAREVYGLYFNDENKEELLSGDLTTTNVTNITVSD
jgi:penicillin-binding protein 2